MGQKGAIHRVEGTTKSEITQAVQTGLFSSWEDLMPDGHKNQQIFDYFNALASNHYRFMNPPPLRRNHRFITTRIVFKIHEIEHLMDAVAEHCNGQVLYLLRHPIATTLSRTLYPRLEHFVHSKYYRTEVLSKNQVREIDTLWSVGSDQQKGIMSWCFENLIPLRRLQMSEWVTISYEELLLNAESSCQMLYRRLDLRNLSRLLETVGEPSTNIAMSQHDTLQIMQRTDDRERRKRLVTKWRTKLSENDEKSAFEILELFGIDVYETGRFAPTKNYLNFPETARILDS